MGTPLTDMSSVSSVRSGELQAGSSRSGGIRSKHGADGGVLGRHRLAAHIARIVRDRAIQLVAFLFIIVTLLFFLLRLTGDPAVVLAGQNATASEVARIRVEYGFDHSLITQYLTFLSKVVGLRFGTSYLNGESALGLVLGRLGATLLLAGLGMAINLVASTIVGCWMGARSKARSGRVAAFLVFITQGIPFYVIGLVLIQLFAVTWGLVPSVGDKSVASWILPAVTLAWFLIPRLTRVVAVNVANALEEEYVRVARASGAREMVVVLRHALPNAVVGAVAFAGTQFAYLLSGTLVVEVVFAWPGLGRLLVNSVQSLDFPVVEAGVFVIALLVFVVNACTDILFEVADPRLRRRSVR